MKVLVVGSGGREHALAWKVAQSKRVSEVLVAPGNAGTARIEKGRNAAVAANDLEGLVELAKNEGVSLCVVGPEDPLCAGLADRMRAAGVKCFGPGADGARLEGSKVFSKEFLDRHRIPTADWRRFDRAGAAKSYLQSLGTWPQVVKADGLAAGKGVFVCADEKEACAVVDRIMEERAFGEAGGEVVIEEFLGGRELSLHVITDGRTLVLCEPVQDYKRVGDGDVGPNTGGMGVFSPTPFASQRLMRQIEQRVLLPTLHALQVEGIEYRGVIFVGLMVSDAGPRVLEYNCRFGDPETQALMRRMESDLVDYLEAAADGKLEAMDPPRWTPRHCVGVIGASEGYPGSYEKGHAIGGLEEAEDVEETVVFHAGTREDGGQILTDGGRVLCVTSLGKGVEEARERAYRAFDRITWSGKFARRDIGAPRAAFVAGRGTSPDSGEPDPLRAH
ncbi:MAG TPA: phosphoribosylamine--glycine ligase [Planctomycetes bacterium]|nr:phosphoribosylamine--glycine ligase [Planctomycetota bacterium]